MFLTEDEVLIE